MALMLTVSERRYFGAADCRQVARTVMAAAHSSRVRCSQGTQVCSRSRLHASRPHIQGFWPLLSLFIKIQLGSCCCCLMRTVNADPWIFELCIYTLVAPALGKRSDKFCFFRLSFVFEPATDMRTFIFMWTYIVNYRNALDRLCVRTYEHYLVVITMTKPPPKRYFTLQINGVSIEEEND